MAMREAARRLKEAMGLQSTVEARRRLKRDLIEGTRNENP